MDNKSKKLKWYIQSLKLERLMIDGRITLEQYIEKSEQQMDVAKQLWPERFMNDA